MLLKDFYDPRRAYLLPKKDFELSIIPKINQYRNQQSLTMAGNKKQILNRRIQIETVANENIRTRLNQQKFYLEYNYNPFSAEAASQFKTNNKHTNFKEPILKNENIIDKLHENLKQKTRTISALKQIKQKIQKMQQSTQRQSNKIKIQTIKTGKSFRTLPSQEKQQIQIRPKKQLQYQLSQLNIQSLCSTKQENFLIKKGNKINIFKLLRDDSECLSGLQQLQRKKFSFCSITQKPKNLKIPVFRDLSNMGRRTLTNSYSGPEKITDHIVSYELVVQINQISFQNLMSVASNRFSPSFLQKLLYDGDDFMKMKEPNDSQSEANEDKDIFEKMIKSQMTNYAAYDMESNQIQIFKQVDFNSQENKMADTCQTQIENILKDIKAQNYLCQQTIRDSTLHLNKTQKIQCQIKRFNKIGQPNSAKKKQIKDLDTLVRLSKVRKDREQLIKIKKFESFLKQKNNKCEQHRLLMRKQLIRNKQNILIDS